MELVTAVQYNIPVRVLILNNNFQGMVRQWQDLFYEGRYSGTPMVNPDFAKLAESMGARGLTATTEAELPKVMEVREGRDTFFLPKLMLTVPFRLQDFLFGDPTRPVVLNAICEVDEHVYPMVPAGHALDACITSRPKEPTG